MNLLKRTIRSYLLYSTVVLIAAIPLFYFITQALCLQDVDEALQDRRTSLVTQLTAHSNILTQLPWSDLNQEIVIYPAITSTQHEKKITVQHFNTLNGEQEPFRELHTYLRVKDDVYPAILRISLIGTEDLIQGIVITATLLMFLILGGLLWINRVQSKRIWRPFYQVLDQLRQFTLDKKPELMFMGTDINEFKDLQRTSHLLAERTYRTYLQQKEFTENAAHEMQTPVASIQAILEVMLQDEQLSSDQYARYQELQDIVTRMSRLNKGLLLLAKIENNQFGEISLIPPVPVIKKILKQLELQIELKKLVLSETYEDGFILGNPALLDILFSNLLHNAVQYTRRGGHIRVITGPNHIEIANTGEALPFSQDKLFRRFQKGLYIESSGGNGLGLAIVMQICKTFHYTIHYQYKENMHHFTLDFHT